MLRHSSRNLPLKLSSPVLPRFARIDQGGVDLGLRGPRQDRVADEFGSIVRAQEHRRAALADQASEDFDDAWGADTAPYVDGVALAGELVDHSEALSFCPLAQAS